MRLSPRNRMPLSSSTARISPTASRAGCGGAAPAIPIVDYVSPSVWAWRPGRARAMRRYVDCVLAILPFEPAAHVRLGGPPCLYVGHPLVERVAELRPNADEMQRRRTDPPVVLVLPGSRSSEIHRLLAIFGAAISRLADRIGAVEVVLPTMPQLFAKVSEGVAGWSVQATHCGRAGGEVVGVSHRARRACGIGDGDARTGACRSADRCRLPGLAHRGTCRAG